MGGVHASRRKRHKGRRLKQRYAEQDPKGRSAPFPSTKWEKERRGGSQSRAAKGTKPKAGNEPDTAAGSYTKLSVFGNVQIEKRKRII